MKKIIKAKKKIKVMPKPEKVKIKEEVEAVELPEIGEPELTEKEILLELYKELQDRKINSISDLENLIARS